VANWMAHVRMQNAAEVTRWYLPGSHSLKTFLLENKPGGGGVASLRLTPRARHLPSSCLKCR